MKPNPKYPSGYTDVEFHRPTAERVAKMTGISWRGPLHGTWVLCDDRGRVLGNIRTLGIRMPVKDRRYSLRVGGCLMTRVAPLLERAIKSDLAPYDTAKDARAAGLDLIKKMRSFATTPPKGADHE